MHRKAIKAKIILSFSIITKFILIYIYKYMGKDYSFYMIFLQVRYGYVQSIFCRNLNKNFIYIFSKNYHHRQLKLIGKMENHIISIREVLTIKWTGHTYPFMCLFKCSCNLYIYIMCGL